MINIGLYSENMKRKSSCKTTRPRALIFGLNYQLYDLYHVCLNNASGAKLGHVLEVTFLHRLI